MGVPTNTSPPPQAPTQQPAAVGIAGPQETPTATAGPAPTPTAGIVRSVQAATPTPTPRPLVQLRSTPTPVPTPVRRILVPPVATPTPTPLPIQIARNIATQPVKFATEDRITLSGQVFNGGGDMAVILSHAFPTDQRSWTAFARMLAEDHGYVVLTFDFRGYGDSGGDTIIPDIDRDVRAALGFIRRSGVARVVLIGASMGGTVLPPGSRHATGGGGCVAFGAGGISRLDHG